ncbi:hypothetical protein ATCC90586_010691 [Pythium insidiosum]|nr:hypothetical protein ATCC90586_010691 [Pythium insidiosum]
MTATQLTVDGPSRGSIRLARGSWRGPEYHPGATKPASCEQIKATIEKVSENDLKGILGCTEDEVVSIRLPARQALKHLRCHAGISLKDNFVTLISWCNNEWGYSNRLVVLVLHMLTIDKQSIVLYTV